MFFSVAVALCILHDEHDISIMLASLNDLNLSRQERRQEFFL